MGKLAQIQIEETLSNSTESEAEVVTKESVFLIKFPLEILMYSKMWE